MKTPWPMLLILPMPMLLLFTQHGCSDKDEARKTTVIEADGTYLATMHFTRDFESPEYEDLDLTFENVEMTIDQVKDTDAGAIFGIGTVFGTDTYAQNSSYQSSWWGDGVPPSFTQTFTGRGDLSRWDLNMVSAVYGDTDNLLLRYTSVYAMTDLKAVFTGETKRAKQIAGKTTDLNEVLPGKPDPHVFDVVPILQRQ